MMTADQLPESVRADRLPAASRLDRLPIVSFHKRMVALLSFIFFFEFGSINTFAFAAPAVMKAWHLSVSSISFIISATFFGMFVGALSGGWFSDKLGRKRALLLTATWFAGFSLLNAFVTGWNGLFITRFLTGVGLSSMTVVGVTYISEMFPAKVRGRYQAWITTIGFLGVPTTAYVARFTIPMATWGWRLVFVWGALGLIFPLFGHFLEESPRWFENHGRYAEADEVLDRIEARAEKEVGALPPAIPASPSKLVKGGYGELFHGHYFPRTLVLSVAWIGQTLGLFGFTSWVPTLLVQHGFSLVKSLGWSSAMAIAAVPGAWLAAVISDRWERKWWIVILALVIAACGVAYGLSFNPISIMIFGTLVELFTHAFAPILYAYTPECYPAAIRNSGARLTYGIGRMANGFGPLIVAFLFKHYGYGSVFMYISGCWLAVSIVIGLFGARTNAKILT